MLITSQIGMNPLESPSRDRLVQNGQSSKFLLAPCPDGQKNDRRSTEANLDNTSDSSYPLDLVEVTDETVSERTLKRYPPGVNRHQTRDPSRPYFTLRDHGLVLNLSIWVLEHELRPGAAGGLEALSDPQVPHFFHEYPFVYRPFSDLGTSLPPSLLYTTWTLVRRCRFGASGT